MTSPRGVGLGGWRRTAHVLAIVAGWVLFFWGWHRVLASTPDFAALQLLMLGAATVVPVVTVSWILHNRGIHRRKGPRRHVPAATLEYRVDFNGREIVADFRALAQVRRVHIVVDGMRKHYGDDAAAMAQGGSAVARGARERHALRRPPAPQDAATHTPVAASADDASPPRATAAPPAS
ncbi:MAG: hypothetical protein HZC37_21080 [Burkholderiales bacterium]|nr:hypothetical protein [Burkholderiales bacterium]